MRISTGIAAALAVGLAPVGAYAATAPAGQELVFHGSAYGFWNPRPDDLEFHLSNTTIRFRMGLDFDVLRWLQASQRTGASIAVLINPAVGEFEDSSTDPTFPALRIAINGAHQQVRPGSHQPLIGRRPGPVPLSVHSLAEAIALRESGQPGAAGPFIDEALADPALRPALKAVALHTRALIAAGADADSEGAPTGTGDVALMKALGDLDLAVSLAPEDVDTANFRGYVLARLGAYDEALAALQTSPNATNDFWRWIQAASIHRWQGRFDLALADMDEIQRRHHTMIGMAYHYNRASALLGLGRYQEAVEELTRGLSQQPDYQFAYFERACGLARLGRLAQAGQDLDKGGALRAATPYIGATPNAEWLEMARRGLGEALLKNAQAPDDSPCMAEHPRGRSPLLAERASVTATPPTPAP